MPKPVETFRHNALWEFVFPKGKRTRFREISMGYGITVHGSISRKGAKQTKYAKSEPTFSLSSVDLTCQEHMLYFLYT